LRIPEKTIDEIASKLDILDYISQDISLKRKGDRFWGCCPFHKEKTPSFSVVPEKGFYYCFGCHKGGNIYSYIMETAHVEFLDAVKIAAEKAGVELEFSGGPSKEERLDKEALLELYKKVTGSFHWILKNSPEAESARQYLIERAVEEESWDFFQLGYAPSDPQWLFQFLKSKNYTSDFLEKSGLFSRNKKTFPLFWRRLMFPIFDHSGRPVAFSGRILQGDGPKYINSPETAIYHKGNLLFALGKTLPFVKEKKEFILCEGNLDVIALYQAGIKNVAAPLGTAFTSDQLKVLKRYCQKGSLMFDSDRAGKEASYKAALMCRQEQLPLDILPLPSGKDPADIFKSQGGEALKKITNNPVKSFDFLLLYAAEGVDTTVPEGKIEIIEKLAPFIHSVSSEIEKSEYFGKIADHLILDKNVVIKEFEGKKGISRKPVRKKENPSTKKLAMNDEIFLVLLLLLNSDLYPMIKEMDREDFETPLARQVLQNLKSRDAFPSREEWEHLSDQAGWADLLLQKENDPLFRMNSMEQFNDVVRKIKFNGLKRKRDEVALLMRKEENQSNERAIWELMQEKKRLDEQIERLKV